MKNLSDFCLNLPLQVPNNFQILNNDFNINLFKTVNPKSGYLVGNYNQVIFKISTKNRIIFQIIPFFENLTFLSRKGLDFQIWVIISKAKFFGYHKNEAARQIMLNLATNMNNARYLNETDFYSDQIKNLNQIIEANPDVALKVEKKTGLKLILPLTISKDN
jgi:hypothetical protein